MAIFERDKTTIFLILIQLEKSRMLYQLENRMSRYRYQASTKL